MSKWFNINYLRAPEMGKAAGTGAAFGAIGDSLMKLGAIGAAREKIDAENKRRAEDVAFRDSELAFRKDVHKDDMDFKNKDFIFRQGAHRDDMNARTNQLNWEMEKFGKEQDWNKMKFDKELLMDEKKLGVERQRALNTKNYYDYLINESAAKIKRQEAERAANISMLRKMYPQATSGWSDEEVFAYGNLRQKEKNGKKESEGVDVPEGYMLASADEIAPLVGKGIIRGEGFKKVGEGKYIIKKTDLVDTLKEAKTQIEMAQHAADFANDEQEKVIPDVLPKAREKKEKKKMPEFKFKPGAYDESERDRFGFDIYDGVM